MVRRPAATLVACLVVAGAVSTAVGAAPQRPARPATDVGGTVAAGTVWTRAGSPYVTTSSVQVPAGVTLVVEPGVTVKLGSYHSLTVAGALQAVGSPTEVVRFEAASVEPWGAIQFAAGSGPSEVGHVELVGGGAGLREMVGIASDAVVVHHALLTAGKGLGVQIKAGASPTVRDSVFYGVTVGNANPPAALHIQGASRAIVTDNFFQSNFVAVAWDPDASPTFVGNRFDRNGVNGVTVNGRVTRSVAWPSLGPRAWAYHVAGTGLEVGPTGQLSIEAGATVRFGVGTSLKVRGTLAVQGTGTAKVLLSDDIPVDQAHLPGQWREIRFEDESVDYDPATGAGSIIDHAIVEYGGGNSTGAVYILEASPRISNTVIRSSAFRGVGVRGANARPQIVGVESASNTTADEGVGLEIAGGAAPEVSFSVFRDNFMGIRLAGGSQARIGPHNAFVGSATYSVVNSDPDTCVDATGNDWSGTGGPLDQSPETDACGQADHLGDGELVSDHVRYEPFEGALAAPAVVRPRCGTTASGGAEIGGYAAPGTDEVIVYDNQVEASRVPVAAGTGGLLEWVFAPEALAPGSHVIQAQSRRGEALGSLSAALGLVVDPAALIDPSTVTASYDLEGNHYVQPYLNDDGCASLRDDHGWAVRPLVGVPVQLAAAVRCPSGAAPSAAVDYLGERRPMSPAPDGRLAVSLAQGAGGTFAIRVTCDGDETIQNLGTINPSADSFVFDALGGPLVRVGGARVTLLVKVPGVGGADFAPWNASDYHGQSNPQTAGPSGWFAFYPPPGTYRVRVEAAGYNPYLSPERTITVEPVMIQIPLQPIGRVYLPAVRRGAR